MNHSDRQALRADLQEELNTYGADPNETQSAEAGARAVERALIEWAQDIREPRGEVTRGPILERYIREGLAWEWIKSYKNRSFAWCGAFASWCWREGVSEATRKRAFASTYRLREWAKGSARLIPFEEARAGDLAIVGHRKAWGDHITVIERREGDTLHTIEGNAHGETPIGRAEGVIKRTRDRDEVAYIYRPLEVDA